jgi:hypothetical protein
MAKAVVPMRAFREKFGDPSGESIGGKLQELAHEFLAHDGMKPEPGKRETAIAKP